MRVEFHGHANEGGLYLICNVKTGHVYVGQTNSFRTRAESHVRLLKCGKHKNAGLQRDYVRDPSAFTFSPVVILSEQADRDQLEKVLIIQLRGTFGRLCYNRKKVMPYTGGRPLSDDHRAKLRANHRGMKGRTHSPETKAKMAAAAMGRKHSARTLEKMSAASSGRTHTNEAKDKIADSARGRKLSAEHVLALQRANTGKKATAETKEKLAASHRGKTHSPERRAKIAVAIKAHWEKRRVAD